MGQIKSGVHSLRGPRNFVKPHFVFRGASAWNMWACTHGDNTFHGESVAEAWENAGRPRPKAFKRIMRVVK